MAEVFDRFKSVGRRLKNPGKVSNNLSGQKHLTRSLELVIMILINDPSRVKSQAYINIHSFYTHSHYCSWNTSKK